MPNQSPSSALLDAAARLEDELRQYEALTEEVGRAVIHSRKSLVRVTRMLQQAAECHERLMTHVASLSEVMTATRGRQVSCAERLVSAGGRIQERMAGFQTLMSRYDALGELSKQLNATAAEIVAAKDETNPQAALAATGSLLERMEQAVSDATALADAARADDFADLARDVDSVKQQLQSAKNQLTMARRVLGERSPS
jgi:chromosome segregation ATPase